MAIFDPENNIYSLTDEDFLYEDLELIMHSYGEHEFEKHLKINDPEVLLKAFRLFIYNFALELWRVPSLARALAYKGRVSADSFYLILMRELQVNIARFDEFADKDRFKRLAVKPINLSEMRKTTLKRFENGEFDINIFRERLLYIQKLTKAIEEEMPNLILGYSLLLEEKIKREYSLELAAFYRQEICNKSYSAMDLNRDFIAAHRSKIPGEVEIYTQSLCNQVLMTIEEEVDFSDDYDISTESASVITIDEIRSAASAIIDLDEDFCESTADESIPDKLKNAV